MTGMLAIYVPLDVVTYGGTFDAGDSHLLNVMRLLSRFGIVNFGNMPVRFKKGASISYTITAWGRELTWLKARRGYLVRIPVEDY